MGTRAINNRIEKFHELEQQKAELEKQINAVKAEITNELTRKGVDELDTGLYLVRYKDVTTNRFDTRTFKAECAELYSKYLKTNICKRFSIA